LCAFAASDHGCPDPTAVSPHQPDYERLDSVEAVGQGPREVEVSATPGESGFLNFAVRDAGTGIGPHLMPHLFESFFTTKPEGLGMGLAIARSIVEAHGGDFGPAKMPSEGLPLNSLCPPRASRRTMNFRAVSGT
jgi:K+-sensing histidine kinase KdpD